MKQILSLACRPKRFSQLIGQSKIIKKIRGHYKNGREPKSWLFNGDTGSGKTTIARIMAVSLQCTHQVKFGEPCNDCYRKKSSFDILEINAGDITGIDELRNAIAGSEYSPKPGSRRRVYIIDEAQGLSKPAQTMLLKSFEECPTTTVWMICTTVPEKIIRTLRGRCVAYTMQGITLEGTRELVQVGIDAAGGNQSSAPLVDALLENKVTSPRMILMAVEKFLAGSEPEEAALVELSTGFDAHTLCRSMIKGDWEEVRAKLKTASSEDA